MKDYILDNKTVIFQAIKMLPKRHISKFEIE